MILKELGKTGVMIPELGIGTSNYRAGASVLRRGMETGALFLDTAESYGTEDIVGEAVRGLRDRVFIATKVSPQNFRSTDLLRSVDASLQRMKVDTIDLLQLHYPNPDIPLTETMGAISGLIDAGKVRFTGVSNFSITQLEEARAALGKYPVVSNQVRYNLIDRTIEAGLLRYCSTNGITVIAYSPLSKGLSRIADCDPDGTLSEIARGTGKSVAQVVLNWCLSKDSVVAIPGGNSIEHILDNCGASGWRLTPEQVALLDQKIRFRKRNRFDALVRKHMPRGAGKIATAVLKHLPRGLRRRLS